MSNFLDKIEHSKKIIKEAVEKYPKIAVACSFGKDSMVALHLAREVDKNIPVFAVMTVFKPPETLNYLVEMNKVMDLRIKVYIVADEVPQILKEGEIETSLLPTEDFKKRWEQNKEEKGKLLYETDPDACCHLLKVEPTKEAVKGLDAWVTGLRKSEGYTRGDYKEVEVRGGLVKINPILDWGELDIWRYLALYQIPVNPLYKKGYRSLGCSPCTKIVDESEPERAGRWQGTSKCGGECGIHTKTLK